MRRLEEISYFKNADEFKQYENILKEKMPISNNELYNLDYVSFRKTLGKGKFELNNSDWFSIPEDILRDLISGYSNRGQGAKYFNIESIQVSKYGDIRIKNKGGEFFYPEIDNDYKPGYLRIKNYPGLGYIYRLAAYALLERPSCNCPVDIHHINNNGYENTKSNLIYLKKCEHKKIHPWMEVKCCKNCLYYKEISDEHI